MMRFGHDVSNLLRGRDADRAREGGREGAGGMLVLGERTSVMQLGVMEGEGHAGGGRAEGP